ncbi:endonuclease/exonuclease/phosphatase family protein [Glycomyces buryatensis]|uniref:Endonuclease/exonuclease/phosphatase family protein n=1 Tax=Glycomyces buryatensis TaxID=2570927 RepID=A0A4S8QBA7_9ACTN|nr:endonuclease/exonuclease/phosphatase family protein [Glycomyces buryatensis]THV41767.1 endonuclease/exonuclease/phosphatase family protein [Glycomyces buryatensis]
MSDPEKPLIGPADAPYLHVMTYNLRSATGQAPQSWWKRRPLVQGLIARERPTVLCTQEGRYRQLLELRADLDGYDWIHLGRGGSSRSESTAVFWESARLAPVEYDHLWLSRHPNVVGSRSWGSRTVRMLTWIRFEDKETGADFHIVDNHLDHRSERAQRKGAEINRDVVARFRSPAIVAGDFNCEPSSKPYKVLTGARRHGAGLTDAWNLAEERLTPEWGTFNRWKTEPVEGKDRIDWILVQSGVKVHQIGVNTYAADGVTPSDHWPLQALVSLE